MAEPAMRMAAVRKCMVRYRRSLLAQGVASMLASNPGIEVVLLDADRMDMLKALRAVRPDVLVLDMNDCDDLTGLLATLLKERSTTKIVCLDPSESTIHILTPGHRVVEHADDLVAMLREEI